MSVAIMSLVRYRAQRAQASRHHVSTITSIALANCDRDVNITIVHAHVTNVGNLVINPSITKSPNKNHHQIFVYGENTFSIAIPINLVHTPCCGQYYNLSNTLYFAQPNISDVRQHASSGFVGVHHI